MFHLDGRFLSTTSKNRLMMIAILSRVLVNRCATRGTLSVIRYFRETDHPVTRYYIRGLGKC